MLFNFSLRWRRSLGAVFSQIWSKDESSVRDNQARRESAVLYQSPSADDEDTKPTLGKAQSESDLRKGVKLVQRSNSITKQRKIAIIRSPPDETDNPLENTELIDERNLTKYSSLEESFSQTSPVKGACSLSSSRASLTGSEKRSSLVITKSQTSLDTPESPQYLRRGKLRGSAGLTAKFVFKRQKAIQKTFSWDELNTERNDNIHMDKKQKRFSISLRRPKSIKDDQKQLDLSTSLSSKSLDHDAILASSSETISSRTSSHSATRDDEANSNTSTDTNNNSNKATKEKKNKFMKTIRSLVSKK